MSKLFEPIQIGNLALKNRLVMAPLTRNRASKDGNVPQKMSEIYYSQRAGAGLIITEATQVSPQGVGYPLTPGIHSKEQVEGWKKVNHAVKAKGGLTFLQLWHVGRISHPDLQPNNELPVAPSAIKPAGDAFTFEGPKPFVTPRALETHEIPGIIEQFVSGARNALDAGFDGVEIHGANGYLLDQFLRDGSNKRTDNYGGSFENRSRLVLEVVDAVLKVWGPHRVGLRLSPLGKFNDMGDSDPAGLYSYLLGKLSERTLAYLHIVEPGEEDLNGAPNPLPISTLRELYRGILMTNGGYDLDRANKALELGYADLISFGKLYLANPDLAERFKARAPLNEPDFKTFYGGGEAGYTDYPFLHQN